MYNKVSIIYKIIENIYLLVPLLLRPQIFLGGLSTGLATHEVAAELVVKAPDDALTGVAVVEPAAEVVIFGLSPAAAPIPVVTVVELRLLSERLPTLALTPPASNLPPSSTTCAQLCTMTPLETVVGEETGVCSIPDCELTRHIQSTSRANAN